MKLKNRIGWSQEQLAERTGLSKTKVSKIINGRLPGNPNDVISIAKALDDAAVIRAKCVDCGVASRGCDNFFSDVDTSPFSELKDLVEYQEKLLADIKNQARLLSGVQINTDVYIEQFETLRRLVRIYSNLAGGLKNIVETPHFLQK